METIKKNNLNSIFTSFYLNKTEIAISVASVQEVVNFPEKIFPMPLAPQFLVGVFNLRGDIIPVINTKKLLNYENCETDVYHKVAIINYEGAKVGLIFDQTSEILRVQPEMFSDFNYVDERSHKVISGAIKLDNGERIIQVIEARSLVTIENVPQILEQQKFGAAHLKSKNKEKFKKCISFTVGHLKMAFEIGGIHEIGKVPEIKQSSMKSESFLGIISLRGMVVPVVDFAKLLKMENHSTGNKEDQRIILLKIEDELFGLLVDGVDSINSYTDEDVMAIPLLSKERINMFKGCVVFNQQEIILLNHHAVLENKEVLELTEGHSKMFKRDEATTSKKQLRGQRQTYISFRLNHLFGIAIRDIKEIIEYRNDIMQAPGLPSFVVGMLNLRGKLVTIIETKKLYQMSVSSERNEATKILIFDRGEDCFGLIVDSVENIVNIDSDKNFKVPELLVQQVKSQFQQDIKEIVAIPTETNREAAMIILNIEPINQRIRMQKSA